MTMINRLTGEEPTEQEWEQIRARAQKLLDSPYSSPEQIAWAMDVPGVILPAIWESCREKAMSKRRAIAAQKGVET